MSQCKCSMSISVLGDGCRYCQPQEYIDRIHDQMEADRAMVVPDGWRLELIGPDEVVKLSRKDGKWCGITNLSGSPRDGLLYPFLRAMLAVAPKPGEIK